LNDFLKTLRKELSILQGNLLIIIASSIFIRFADSMVFPYESLYIRELGASPSIIGLIGSLGSIILILTRIPGGYIADKYGRRKIIVTMTFVLASSFLFYAFAPSWEFVLMGVILFNISTIYSPALLAIIADSIPPDQRGVGYALRGMLPSMASIFAPIIGGLFVQKYGLVTGMRGAYILVTVFYLISALIRVRLEETLEKVESTEANNILSSLKESFTSIPDVWRSMPKNFRSYMIATIISSFSGPLVYPFLALFAVDVIGITSFQWGFLGTIGILVGLMASYPLGKLVDKIPRKTSIVISIALWLPTLGLVIVSRNFVFLVFFFILKGVYEVLSATAFQGMVADLIPRESRGRIGSVERTVCGIVSMVSFAISGFLYQNNPVYPFLLALILDCVTLLLVIFLLKEPEKREI